MKKITEFLFRNRIRLSFLFFGCFIARDILIRQTPNDIFSTTNLWGPLGALAAGAGAFLRSWAAGVLMKNERPADTGPYALIAHPLYAGSMLIALGFCSVIGDPLNVVAVAVVAAVIYAPKIRSEEKYLRNKFGDEYRRPPLKSVLSHMSGAHWSFKQWKKNREYNTFCVTVVMLAVLKIINVLSH